ncbi:MAG: CotH kinase family protein [Ignavibacteria bacterium]|jgi:spore coat protein H
MVKFCKNIFLLFFVFFFSSCDEITEPEDNSGYGLPVYKIEIDDEDYAQFKANIFTNYSVAAELNADGKDFKIKIEHHGYTSREFLKSSYEINFVSSGKDPHLNRSEIILSSQVIDPSMLRTLLACEGFNAAGLITYKAQPVVVYINDLLEGLYLLVEPINEEFFTARGLQVDQLYEAINTKAQFTVKDGFYVRDGFRKRIPDDENFYTLKELIYLLDTEPLSTLPEKLEAKLDVDSYLRYCAITYLTGNWDGIIHNFHLFRDKATGIFEFVPWDLDRTFYTYNGDMNLNKLFDKVVSIDKYKTMYEKHLKNLSGEEFSIQFCESKINQFKDVIKQAYNADRWFEANGYELETEAGKITAFISSRNL